jgi:hypothetical protein
MARNRTQKIAVSMLAVGLFALAAAGALGAFGGKGQVATGTTTTTTAPTTTLPPLSNLGEVGAKLGALIDAGRKVDYAAVYAVDDPSLPAGSQTVEIWRKADQFRQDIVTRDGPTITRQTIVMGTKPRTCQTNNGAQTCQLVPGDQLQDLPGAFHRITVLASRPPKLTMRSAVVAQYKATCFTAVGDGFGKLDKKKKPTKGTGELCLNGDGTLLRWFVQGVTIELTSISSSVPASAFDTTEPATTTTTAAP